MTTVELTRFRVEPGRAEPVAILFVSILHFITDGDDPYGTVARFRDAAAPGSFMVVSHVTSQNDPRLAAAVQRLYHARAADGKARSRDEIAGFFGRWEMTEPGLVYMPQWRPDPADDVPACPEQFWFLGGVARKPVCSSLQEFDGLADEGGGFGGAQR